MEVTEVSQSIRIIAHPHESKPAKRVRFRHTRQRARRSASAHLCPKNSNLRAQYRPLHARASPPSARIRRAFSLCVRLPSHLESQSAPPRAALQRGSPVRTQQLRTYLTFLRSTRLPILCCPRHHWHLKNPAISSLMPQARSRCALRRPRSARGSRLKSARIS